MCCRSGSRCCCGPIRRFDVAQIGQLRTRIRIEQPTRTVDAQGGRSTTWATLATLWALVEPLSGREALMAAQVTAVLSTGITIWFRDDISVKQRIVIGSRTLQIESFQDPTGMRDELRLLCSEVLA